MGLPKIVRMKNILLLLVLSSLIASESNAQFTRYVVKLKNKGGTPFTFANPNAYLSQRAIDRRTRYGIAIDSTDLPCTPAYITQIRNVPNVTVLNVSKWLNAVSIQTSDANAITTINAFPFVVSTTGVAAKIGPPEPDGKFGMESIEGPVPPQTQRLTGTMDFFNYGATSFNEIHLHNGEFLHNIGLRGQGMQIAVMDGGFFNYSNVNYHAFDSARINGQFLDTWDFVNREVSVVEDDSHGMSCLSTIAANIPGTFVGKAPKASFRLYRTEDVFSEHKIEEFNWACGAERSDSTGADVISTSLGYYIQMDPPSVDHPNSDMDGNTTMAAIAGDLAAKKGLLVFASIGNDGGNPVATHFLSTPSDGDSVLAIGAVNVAGTVANFSSYGPSADGQVKPDLSSVGVSALVQTSAGGIGVSNGTSFACPNMAGMGSCLWQGFPEYSNMKIRDALWRSSNMYATPNNRIGYGIPNVKTAFTILLMNFATASVTSNNCDVTVNWASKDVNAMKYEIERDLGAGFIKVGERQGTGGDVLSNKNYTFNETLLSANPGIVKYRIRQIIDTATATFAAVYTDTVSFTLATACPIVPPPPPVDPNKTKVTVIPNPARDNTPVTVKVETPTAIVNMSIQLVDMKGRVVMRIHQPKPAGPAVFDLPVGRIAAGKYVIAIYDGSKKVTSSEFLKL